MERKDFFKSMGAMLAYGAIEEQKKKKPAPRAGVAPKQCSTCVHFNVISSGATGYCQRYPKVYGTGGLTLPSAYTFPIMNGTDYCGEYTWEAQP